MIIPAKNILADSAQFTFSTNQEVVGTNVLRWKNPSAFQSNWALQVGATGDANSEVLLLSSSMPAGTAGTLSGSTLYEHPSNTPIYAIKFDQIVFERSTTGTVGTASPMTNGTITINPSSLTTNFDDTSGSSVYAYRTYFRNSLLSVNSTESDWITVSPSFTFYSLAALRDKAKNRLWNARYLSDDVIDDWINEWNDEMNNGAVLVNEDFALGTVDVAFGTAGMGTITNADFKQVKRLWVTYDGVNYYKSRKMDSNSFIPTQQFTSTQPHHYYQGDNIFGIKPEQSGGTARLEYYKLAPRLINDTDELPFPMRGYTKSYVDYCESLSLSKDGKYPEAQQKLTQAQAARQQFVTEITPRDKTGQEYIEITEAISGDDFYPF